MQSSSNEDLSTLFRSGCMIDTHHHKQPITNNNHVKVDGYRQHLFDDDDEDQDKFDNIKVISNGWQSPKLTTVGLYYPIGPLNVHLPQACCSPILQKLPQVFQRLSLNAQYHDSPVSASCLSVDGVRFELCLFASRHTNNTISELIVEISRKQGDTYLFQQYSHCILTALENEDELLFGSSYFSRSESWNKQQVGKIDLVVGPTQHELLPNPVDQALETVKGMLLTDRFDAQQLGMETLVHMTHPGQSGEAVATATAQVLLNPQTSVQQILCKAILQTAFNYVDDASNLSDMALLILAQALRVASQQEQQQYNTIPAFWITYNNNNNHNNLVDCLWRDIDQVQNHPHRAYYALECLTVLCQALGLLQTQICARCELLEHAHRYGAACHQALAIASRQLLRTCAA